MFLGVNYNLGRIILWPRKINLSGYKRIASFTELWSGYGITIVYTVLGIKY